MIDFQLNNDDFQLYAYYCSAKLSVTKQAVAEKHQALGFEVGSDVGIGSWGRNEKAALY